MTFDLGSDRELNQVPMTDVLETKNSIHEFIICFVELTIRRVTCERTAVVLLSVRLMVSDVNNACFSSCFFPSFFFSFFFEGGGGGVLLLVTLSLD